MCVARSRDAGKALTTGSRMPFIPSQAVPRSSPVTCTAVGPGHEAEVAAELEPGAAGGAATGSGFHWPIWVRSNSDVTGPEGIITVALGVLPAPVTPPWCHGLRGMGMVDGVSVRLRVETGPCQWWRNQCQWGLLHTDDAASGGGGGAASASGRHSHCPCCGHGPDTGPHGGGMGGGMDGGGGGGVA